MIRIATLGILAAFVLACGDGGDGARVDEGTPGTGVCEYDYEIAIVGDSHSWMPGYSDLIEAAFPPGDVRTIALFGLTSEDWLPTGDLYVSARFSSYVPRVVSILLSTNDANILRSSPELVRDNLETIVDALLEDGVCEVVIMTPPPFYFPIPEVVELLAAYSDGIRQLCGTPGDAVACGPDLHAILGREHSLDGIHPNELGHALIFETLLPILNAPRDNYPPLITTGANEFD